MDACLQCKASVENPTVTGVLCASCYATETAPKVGWSTKLGPLGLAAIALVVLSFTCHFRVTNSTSMVIDGAASESAYSSIDYVALPLSALGVLLAIGALLVTRTAPKSSRGTRLALGGVALLAGAYQLFASTH